MNLISSSHLSDYESVARTWKERLFTLPWRPWVRTKSIHRPKVFQYGNTIICSPATLKSLEKTYCPRSMVSYDDVHNFDR